MDLLEKRPLVRWAGSKRKLIPKLIQYWDAISYKRYVEPFAGSACLFYSAKPKKALLNDLNSELIHTYACVRDHPRAVYNRLLRLPIGKRSYYNIRKLNTEKLDELDRAARFIYLNRFCFNGIYRTNMEGKFNVPYSNNNNRTLPDIEEIKEAANHLKNVKLLSKDFEEVLLKHTRKGDFVYLDPPYAVSNRKIFKQYGPDTFGIEDLERLRSALMYLDKKKIKFLVSYAYCKEALNTFDKWDIRRVYTQRNVSGFAEHRRRAVEIIVTNIK